MTASAPTGRLTRVTLVGSARRVDVVLPSDEPLGVLLPEVAAMLGYGPSGRPHGFQVSTVDGSALDPVTSLRAAGIADGTLLRVDPLTEAPPAAIVYDVPDAVADDLARRPGRWGDRARRWTATCVGMTAAVAAVVLAGAQVPPWLLALAGLTVVSGGFVLALPTGRAVGVALVLGGAASVVAVVPGLTANWLLRSGLWTLVISAVVALLGLAAGRRRAGLFGSGTAIALLTLWSALFAAGLPADRVAVVMTVVAVGGLGLLPRIAVMSSGLTKLDDRLAAEETVSRSSAEAAVDAAHRGLALACVAVAVSSAVAGALLAWTGGTWAVVLAGLLVIVILLRLRAFPLTAEVVALVIGALVVLGFLVTRWVNERPDWWWGGTASMTVVLLLCLVVVGYAPSPHARARARQFADRLEALVVIAVVPVAVGEFDMYARLLSTF